MRVYESQCRSCSQMSVLYGVCRVCRTLNPLPQRSEPDHPLHGTDDAPTTDGDPAAPADHDERGDACDDIPDFDLGPGG